MLKAKIELVKGEVDRLSAAIETVDSSSVPCGPLHVVKSRRMVTLYDEESAASIHVIKSGSKGMFVTIHEDPYEEAVADTVSESEAVDLCQEFDTTFSVDDLPVLVTLGTAPVTSDPASDEAFSGAHTEGGQVAFLDEAYGIPNREELTSALRELVKAVCKVQDWDGTRVGHAIDVAERLTDLAINNGNQPKTTASTASGGGD